MANPPRIKGTRAETAAAAWLTDELGITISRGPLRGNADRGDLFGLPDTTIEIKNCKTPNLKQWARELDVEMRNGECRHGVILWSPPGVGMSNVDKWIAISPHAPYGFTVPHIGPLNALHRYVTTMDTWNYITSLVVGDGVLYARLARSWINRDPREHMNCCAA